MVLITEVNANVLEVDNILRTKFNKQLFYPKQEDQLRLLRLRLWSERYCVSIEYLLDKLIPHFEKIAMRHRGKAFKSKGIGTTISVLTGPAAEEFIIQQVGKDFPNNENKSAAKQEARDRILLEMRKAEGIDIGKPKSILQFKTVTAYNRYYRTRITAQQKLDSKIEKLLMSQPWRGNPFR